MSLFHLKDGTPITVMEWAQKYRDEAYSRIAETSLAEGRWVSTVWLGVNQGFGAVPLIFETMVFAREGAALGEVLDSARYATEADAREGHAEMVARWMLGESGEVAS